MKKETLEEAAERFLSMCNGNVVSRSSFIAGANYQAERMFSEEDMKKAYEHGMFSIIETGHGDTFDEWFIKFKKK
jgi:hypothetical protein